MKINLISKYRTELMGIAILWVMLFHSNINFNSPILNFLRAIGYGGVDIFMFLSGFGIFYSLSVKKEPLNIFYKKRALRILPYYLPIVLMYSCFNFFHNIWGLRNVFFNITTISFWLGYNFDKIFDWYIPSIIVLYLISPFFYYLFRLNKNLTTIAFVSFFYIVSYILSNTPYVYLVIFTMRASLYFIGFWVASNANKNIKTPVLLWSFLLIVVVLISFFFIYPELSFRLLTYHYFLAFSIITIPLCLVLTFTLSLFKNYKYPFLSFFGTNTLIFYIFHDKLIALLSFYGMKSSLINALGTIALTIAIGILWKKIVDKSMLLFNKFSIK